MMMVPLLPQRGGSLWTGSGEGQGRRGTLSMKHSDSSAYQDDTLNTINSLNDSTGISAYPCAVVSLSQFILFF